MLKACFFLSFSIQGCASSLSEHRDRLLLSTKGTGSVAEILLWIYPNTISWRDFIWRTKTGCTFSYISVIFSLKSWANPACLISYLWGIQYVEIQRKEPVKQQRPEKKYLAWSREGLPVNCQWALWQNIWVWGNKKGESGKAVCVLS